MKSIPRNLASYTTEILQFQFYFPSVGVYSHYPSNVSIDEKVTARGELNNLKVVTTRKINQENVEDLNFDDMIQVGTQDDILQFIRTKNILQREKNFEFGTIKYLLQDKDFWQKCVAILEERSIREQLVWQYASKH